MVGEFPILCGKAKRACSIMAGFGWDNRDLRDERDRDERDLGITGKAWHAAGWDDRDLRDERDRDERDFRDNREGVACRGLG